MVKKKGTGLPGDEKEEEAYDGYEFDGTDIEGGYPVVSSGRHVAVVIELEQGDSKSGNPQFVWQFKVIEGGPDKDKEIRYWTSLLPQARWKVAETLEALGVETIGRVAKFTKDDVIGKPCYIEVSFDQSRDSHKVDKVYSADKEAQKVYKDWKGVPL